MVDCAHRSRPGADRGVVVAPGGIEREVESNSWVGPSGGILVLLDADDDCPAELAPTLLNRARSARPDCRVSVVLANREFEAWFLASAQSLAGRFGFPADIEAPLTRREYGAPKDG